jgi:hypothetical protein
VDLEDRFGFDNARSILRTLERVEGISDSSAFGLSCHERLRKVMSIMKDDVRHQTLH